MADEFEVEQEVADAVDIEKIAREELEKHGHRVKNTWQKNLEAGEGADGNHGGPYVNTGEAVNDVTVEWIDDYTIRIGGDVVQLAVSEFGRAPGSPPPREPIADWAREKGLEPERGQTFMDMVDAIRFAIGDRGLDGFAPAQAAATEHRGDLKDNVESRAEEELEAADVDAT